MRRGLGQASAASLRRVCNAALRSTLPSEIPAGTVSCTNRTAAARNSLSPAVCVVRTAQRSYHGHGGGLGLRASGIRHAPATKKIKTTSTKARKPRAHKAKSTSQASSTATELAAPVSDAVSPQASLLSSTEQTPELSERQDEKKKNIIKQKRKKEKAHRINGAAVKPSLTMETGPDTAALKHKVIAAEATRNRSAAATTTTTTTTAGSSSSSVAPLLSTSSPSTPKRLVNLQQVVHEWSALRRHCWLQRRYETSGSSANTATTASSATSTLSLSLPLNAAAGFGLSSLPGSVQGSSSSGFDSTLSSVTRGMPASSTPTIHPSTLPVHSSGNGISAAVPAAAPDGFSTREVHAAERTQLLSALLQDPSAYPQLYAFFYPDGHDGSQRGGSSSSSRSGNHHSRNNIHNSKSTTITLAAPPGTKRRGPKAKSATTAATSEDGAVTSSSVSTDAASDAASSWVVEGVAPLLQSEAAFVSLLVLLRAHQHAVHEDSPAGVQLHDLAWTAMLNALKSQLASTLTNTATTTLTQKEVGGRAHVTTATTVATAALILHLLTDVYRDQLAIGGAAAAQQRQSNRQKLERTPRKRNQHALTARQAEQQRVTQRNAAKHVRVAQVLAELVVPLYGTLISAEIHDEADKANSHHHHHHHPTTTSKGRATSKDAQTLTSAKLKGQEEEEKAGVSDNSQRVSDGGREGKRGVEWRFDDADETRVATTYGPASAHVIVAAMSALAAEAASLLADEPDLFAFVKWDADTQGDGRAKAAPSSATTTHTCRTDKKGVLAAAQQVDWQAWRDTSSRRLFAFFEAQKSSVAHLSNRNNSSSSKFSTSASSSHLRSHANATLTAAAGARLFLDVLRCLRWSEELEVVLRATTLGRIESLCQAILLFVCENAVTVHGTTTHHQQQQQQKQQPKTKTASNKKSSSVRQGSTSTSVESPADQRELFEFLCTPEVAHALNCLAPDRNTYAQAVTDLCSVAAAYAQRHSSEEVKTLVKQLEERSLQSEECARGRKQESSAFLTTSSGIPSQETAAKVASFADKDATSYATTTTRATADPLFSSCISQNHNPAVQITYAMLRAGFNPSSLLTSTLCLSLSPRDTLDVVRAADIFSMACGTSALPVRTRAALVDQVSQQLTQCRRDSHRVVASSVDVAANVVEGEGEGNDQTSTHNNNSNNNSSSGGGSSRGVRGRVPTSVKARVAEGAMSGTALVSDSSAVTGEGASLDAPHAPHRTGNTPNCADKQILSSSQGIHQKKRKSSKSNRSGSDAVVAESNTVAATAKDSSGLLTPAVYRAQVNHLLYVSIESIVECVVRGDVAGVETLGHALLPLLQQEGREAALTEGFECIYTAVRQRLGEMGVYEHRAHVKIHHNNVGAERANTNSDIMRSSEGPPGHGETTTGVLPVHMNMAMTTGMEDALAALTSLFLPHMTELAMKLLTSTSTSMTAALSSPSSTTHHDNRNSSNDSSSESEFHPRGMDAALCGVHAASSRAEGSAPADGLMELALRLSSLAILCGMPAGAVAQLTTLHNTLLRSHERVSALAASTARAADPRTGGSALPTNADGDTEADEQEGPTRANLTVQQTNLNAAVSSAFAVVERLERFLSDLSRHALPWRRHPQSPHVRSGGVAVQQVLAIYIASTANVVRAVTQQSTIESAAALTSAPSEQPSPSLSNTAGNHAGTEQDDVHLRKTIEGEQRRSGSGSQSEVKSTAVLSQVAAGEGGGGVVVVSAQYKHYLLTVVHLLYRLSVEFPVDAEPAALRQFRVEVLDPALTAVLNPYTSPFSRAEAPAHLQSATVQQLESAFTENGAATNKSTALNTLRGTKTKKKGTGGRDATDEARSGGEMKQSSPAAAAAAVSSSTNTTTSKAALQMPLTSLTEVVVVMCVPESVQHVSASLMRGVVAGVAAHLRARELQFSHAGMTTKAQATTHAASSATVTMEGVGAPMRVADTLTGVLATQLLSAAATVHLRADDTLTSMLLQLLQQLSPFLNLWQAAVVLARLHVTGAPLAAAPVRALVERVSHALTSCVRPDEVRNQTNSSEGTLAGGDLTSVVGREATPRGLSSSNASKNDSKNKKSQMDSETASVDFAEDVQCTPQQQIHMLHLLTALQRTVDAAVAEQRWSPAEDADVRRLVEVLDGVPYASLLQELVGGTHVPPEESANAHESCTSSSMSLAQRGEHVSRRSRCAAYTIGECGLLVEVAAHLSKRIEAEKAAAAGHDDDDVVVVHPATVTTPPNVSTTASPSMDADTAFDEVLSASTGSLTELSKQQQREEEAVRQVPRLLAVHVLQSVQLPYSIHDIPPLLRGYAALTSAPMLQQQMLRAFILRTMRATPLFTPAEVVACVEAYAAGGVVHEPLFGVLLGRAADMGRQLTLDLSIQLLRCGVGAGQHSTVRTMCVTAVQPIFSAQVRGLLQRDPRTLVSVAATALAILNCLRDCFPQDDISAAVLANVARYRHDAALSVLIASLALMEKRGASDYDVAHVLARHCAEAVLPTCTAAELTTLTCLLLGCGLRSSSLLSVVYARLTEVMESMSGSSLAKLIQALLQASVEVDTTLVQLLCERIVQLTLVKAEDDETSSLQSATAAATTTASATRAMEISKGEENKQDEKPVSATNSARRKIKAAAATIEAANNSLDGKKGKSTGEQKHPTTSTAAAALPHPHPLPPPSLTLPQVCVFLRLLRTIGRRQVTTSMETADALLAYVRTRVEVDAASVQPLSRTHAPPDVRNAPRPPTATGKATPATTVTTAADAASPQALNPEPTYISPVRPTLPVLADAQPREMEELLRGCIDLSSKPKTYGTLVDRLADALAHLLADSLQKEKEEAGGVSNAALPASPHPHRHPRSPAVGVRRAGFNVRGPDVSRSNGSVPPSSSASLLTGQGDLILLVDLCSLFVRLGASTHPVVPMLFGVLYDRRGTLLQRALLVKTTRQALELAGRAAHPELYKLIVDGDFL